MPVFYVRAAFSIFATLLLAATCLVAPPIVLAQTKVTEPYGVGGTRTVETSEDGRTITETIDLKTFPQIHSRAVTQKDAAGNLLRHERWATAKYSDGGTWTAHSLDKYNESGGFHFTGTTSKKDAHSETFTETTAEYDLETHLLSGTRTVTTITNGNKTVTKEIAKDGQWVQEVSLLTPVSPKVGSGEGGEYAVVPDTAGPGGQILATFKSSQDGGPSGQAIVAFVQKDGSTKYFTARPDHDDHVVLSVPLGAVAVELFKSFKADGAPDENMVRCEVNSAATVPNTDAVANVPARGVVIQRAATAYERGGQSGGIMSVQTRGTDVASSLQVDDVPLQTLATSNSTVKAKLPDDLPLGRHLVGVQTPSEISNAVATDVVTLQADPIPPAEAGSTVPLTVHVNGLPAGDSAVMDFQIGGAAVLADGSNEQLGVPVVENMARVMVRSIRAGSALVKFHLRARLATT